MYATLQRSRQGARRARPMASQVEPLLPTLPATTALVRMWRGELTEAIDEGRKAVELHPVPADLARQLRDGARVRRPARRGARAIPARLGDVARTCRGLRALEATCLAKMDRLEDARRILGRARAASPNRVRGRVLHGDAARRAGSARGGVRGAGTGVHENSAFLYSIEVDPKMEPLRGDARFARICRRDVTPSGKTR